MASRDGVRIVDLCCLSPSETGNQLSLPLTFLDIMWLRFHPVERLFFYEMPQLTLHLFFHSVLPNLKTSLSITLSHFLPLAGNLLWPPHCAKPFLQYTPGDSVIVTLAEFNDATAFDRLAGGDARPAAESRPLVPQLTVSETKASAIALQLTLFPNKGLCIGLTCHHAILDGQSSTMFMKAWAHIFKNIQESGTPVTLTPELTPVFDRDSFKDPAGFDMLFLDRWIEGAKDFSDSNPRSLKLLDDMTFSEDLFRATFRLSQDNVNNLKKKLLSLHQGLGREQRRFSTFVTTCAYVVARMLKAAQAQGTEKAYFVFAVDFRSRSNPPIPKNNVGSWVGFGGPLGIEAGDFTIEDITVTLAEKISDEIKEVEKNVLEVAEGWLHRKFAFHKEQGAQVIGVAGSPRFEVYKTDFGWGKPKKVEIVSIDRGRAIGMAENRDDSGGIEVGLVLNKKEMEIFDSEFHLGLKISS